MQIRCPECQFTRHVDETKIPSTAALATCPKCRHRFRFRDFAAPDEFVLEPDPDQAQPSIQQKKGPTPPLADTPAAKTHNMSQSGDIWNDIASMADKPVASALPQSVEEEPAKQHADEAAGIPSQSDIQEQSPNVPPSEVQAASESTVQTAESHITSAEPVDTSVYTEEQTEKVNLVHDTQQDSVEPKVPSRASQFKDVVDAHHAAKSDPLGVGRSDDSVGYNNAPQNPDGYWEGNDSDDTKPNWPHDPRPTRRVEVPEDFSGIPDDLHERLNRPEPQDIPWEWPDRFGFFPAFIETVKRVLLSPSRFFATMRPGITITAPITFYLLTGLFEELASRGWFLAAARVYHDAIAASPFAEVFNQIVQSSSSISMLLISVLFMILKLMLFSGLFQTFLRLLNADKGGFTTTFRVIAYSNAVGFLALLPFFGQLVGPLWYFLLVLIGIKNAHRIGWGKAFFAVLPVFLMVMIFIVMSARAIVMSMG